VRVHLAGEHPGELEALDFFRDAFDLADHVREGGFIRFFRCELVQLRGFAERLVDPV
jgi:hypothetical protein